MSGTGDGANLLFTAHLDTDSPTGDPVHDSFRYRDTTLADPEWIRCWLEDGTLRGYPISNDRGPMSCFPIAAKALRKAGIGLSGKICSPPAPARSVPSRSRSSPAWALWRTRRVQERTRHRLRPADRDAPVDPAGVEQRSAGGAVACAIDGRLAIEDGTTTVAAEDGYVLYGLGSVRRCSVSRAKAAV